MKISAFIFSYAITKGMKSYGPKGILSQKTKPYQSLINCQINALNKIVPNICVITGFGREKIIKQINNSVIDIYNDRYETANEGHALARILQNSDIDNILILCDGIILGLRNEDLTNTNSIIFVTKKTNPKFNLGCVIDEDSNLVENIFYDVSDIIWCEAILLKKQEITILQNYMKNNVVDNMFLFELINESIKLGAKYSAVKISNKNVKKIESIKDANKVKEINI